MANVRAPGAQPSAIGLESENPNENNPLVGEAAEEKKFKPALDLDRECRLLVTSSVPTLDKLQDLPFAQTALIRAAAPYEINLKSDKKLKVGEIQLKIVGDEKEEDEKTGRPVLPRVQYSFLDANDKVQVGHLSLTDLRIRLAATIKNRSADLSSVRSEADKDEKTASAQKEQADVLVNLRKLKALEEFAASRNLNKLKLLFPDILKAVNLPNPQRLYLADKSKKQLVMLTQRSEALHQFNINLDAIRKQNRVLSAKELRYAAKGLELPLENAHNKCLLIVSKTPPGPDLFASITAGQKAYIRYKKDLWFVDTTTQNSEVVKNFTYFELENLDRDLQVQRFAEQRRELTGKELNLITLHTGHATRKLTGPTPKPKEELTWRDKNGADLLVSDVSPADKDFNADQLPFRNAAFLRHKDQIWYLRKNNTRLQEFLTWLGLRKMQTLIKKMSQDHIEHFDAELQTAATRHRELSDADLKKIAQITNFHHRTLWQRALNGFGLFCVGFIALSCGISTAAMFIGANMMTGGGATAIAAAFFFTGAFVNWKIFMRSTGPVLIDLFGREKFLVDEKGKPLSGAKTGAMVMAGVLSLSVGLTFAGLTYVSTLALPAVFGFLGAVSVALPPVGAALAVVTFICMTALMFKDISDLFKKTDVVGEVIKFLKGMVDIDPESPQNKGKSLGRIIFERGLTIAMTVAFLPLAGFGLYMTQNTCAPGVKEILVNWIPRAADAVSQFVCLGLAFLGQIPFGIASTVDAIGKFAPALSRLLDGKKAKQPAVAVANRGEIRILSHDLAVHAAKILAEEKLTAVKSAKAKAAPKVGPQPDSVATKVVNMGNVVVNGVGNGVLAGAGTTNPAMRLLGIIAGTINSITAGTQAALKAADVLLRRLLTLLKQREHQTSDGYRTSTMTERLNRAESRRLILVAPSNNQPIELSDEEKAAAAQQRMVAEEMRMREEKKLNEKLAAISKNLNAATDAIFDQENLARPKEAPARLGAESKNSEEKKPSKAPTPVSANDDYSFFARPRPLPFRSCAAEARSRDDMSIEDRRQFVI